MNIFYSVHPELKPIKFIWPGIEVSINDKVYQELNQLLDNIISRFFTNGQANLFWQLIQ